MSINFACPDCSTKYSLEDKLASKKVNSRCGATIGRAGLLLGMIILAMSVFSGCSSETAEQGNKNDAEQGNKNDAEQGNKNEAEQGNKNEAEQGNKKESEDASVTSTLKIPTLHPVRGQVSYDGSPLSAARVALVSMDGGASRVFAATTDGRGDYKIQAHYSTGSFSGAPVGRYKVLVNKIAPSELSEEEFDRQYQKKIEQESESGLTLGELEPSHLLNPKFSNGSTTPLTVEVREGENTFTLDLKSDGTGSAK